MGVAVTYSARNTGACSRGMGDVAMVESGLQTGRVSETLARLHRDSKLDKLVILRAAPAGLMAIVQGKPVFETVEPQLKSAHLKIGYEAGELIYNTARAIGARRVVEFGTSFGFSTIYLAAAVRDNGGGTVITTELEPTKVLAARKNLEVAGLASYVDVREGDAKDTLREIEAPIDMVLLDGWNDLYVPLVKMLTPQLRYGSVVFADNINIFKTALRPYVEYMRDARNGFVSTTTSAGSGLEYSVYLPTADP